MKYPMLRHKEVPYFVYPRKDAKGVQYFKATLPNGETLHRSTRKMARSEAIQVAIAAIDKALSSDSILAGNVGHSSPLLSEGVSQWVASLNTALSASTIGQIERFMEWVVEAFPGARLADLSIPTFHAYLNDLKTRKAPSASYWRDMLVRYRQFFNWCILTQKTTLDPTIGYKRPRTSDYTIYEDMVEDQEFTLLCAHINPKDEFVLRYLRYTGVYPQDYAMAEKQDFYIRDGVLHLHMKRGKNKFRFHQPLDGRIEPAIKAIWLSKKLPTDRMFESMPLGQPYKTWYFLLQKRLYKVWIHLFGKHKKIGALRHSWVTECIERGVPEDVLLQWAGHSPKSTVYRERYLHRKSTTRYRYVESPSAPSTHRLHHG